MHKDILVFDNVGMCQKLCRSILCVYCVQLSALIIALYLSADLLGHELICSPEPVKRKILK